MAQWVVGCGSGMLKDPYTSMKGFNSPSSCPDSKTNLCLPTCNQDHDTQTEEQCLQVEPNELQHRLERKYHDLLQHCQGKMMGEEPQKEDTLGKLEQELRESSEEFLHTYRQRFRQVCVFANPQE